MVSQGSRNLICCECWNEKQKDSDNKWNQVDWQKSCDDQWLQRGSKQLQDFKKRQQPRTWYKRSIAEKRKRDICMTTREICPVWMRARLRKKYNSELDEEDEAMGEDDLIQSARQEEYITAMDRDDQTATPTEMFVEKVVTVQDIYFLCRQKHCSMVILSEHWVHNQPQSKYRCPACGEQYRPWKLQPNFWTANKVLPYYGAVCLPEDRAELAAGSSDGPADDDQVMIFPVHWPDYSHEETIIRFHRIIRDIKAELNALPPQDRLGYAMEHLPDPPRPYSFQQHKFLPQTQALIDDLNCNHKTIPHAAWQYDHIKETGYRGVKLGPEQDLDKPLHQTEFLRSWGFALWLSDAFSP
jgi:hypothetical protein